MKFARALVVASLASCVWLVLYALSQTSSLRSTFSTNITQLVGPVLLALPVLGWPWFRAHLKAAEPDKVRSVKAFALMSPLVCLFFYSSIAEAPAEGVGYGLIFCTLATWGVYAIVVK